MCTVAFLPLDGGGYVLGHNRDESRRRGRGVPPRRGRRSGRAFIAPRDADAGGTWIGVNDAGSTLCILNAAEADPSRLPPAPPSRGRILWDLLGLARAEEVGARLRGEVALLRRVRAFHLVVATLGSRAAPGGRGRARGRGGPAHVVRFRWDGARLTEDRRGGPTLFVSSGFDQAGAVRERGRSWRRFLAALGEEAGGLERLLSAWLASHEPRRGALSVCMHRAEASSVSRSLVVAAATSVRLVYHDGPPCDAASPDFVGRMTVRT